MFFAFSINNWISENEIFVFGVELDRVGMKDGVIGMIMNNESKKDMNGKKKKETQLGFEPSYKERSKSLNHTTSCGATNG